MSKDRASQSLRNLGTALERLEEALQEPETNRLAVDGTIQRFEFVMELYCKTLEHFLTKEGIPTRTPRETLQEAYQAEWINNESAWLQMLDDRNVSSHVYDEKTARRIYANIKAYWPEMQRTYQSLAQRFG